MRIDPFLAGIFITVFVELAMLFIAALFKGGKK